MTEGSDRAMPELITVEEVAKILSVSDRTVRRLCASGELPHIYIGSQLRLDKTDLENYLKTNKKGVIENERNESN